MPRLPKNLIRVAVFGAGVFALLTLGLGAQSAAGAAGPESAAGAPIAPESGPGKAASSGTNSPSGNLPVLRLTTGSEIGSETRIPCTVEWVPVAGGTAEASGPRAGRIRVRGATSQVYDKKSFSLKLDRPERWLGPGDNRDWILNAAFVDCSMMRHKLSFDLFRSLSGPAGPRQAPSSRFVEVDLNGRYHGVYLLMEPVERSTLGFRRIDRDVKVPAVLYKAVDHAANFGEPGHADFEQHEPDPDRGEFWEPLDELNAFVSGSLDREFGDAANGIASRIDLGNVIDFHLLLLFTSNMDGSDKNFYLARDAVTGEGPRPRFFFVPWDYDATFGRNWEGSPVGTEEWQSNHLFDRLLQDPGYRSRFAARWRELRSGPFSVERVVRLIEDNVRTLGDAAICNERRWRGKDSPEAGGLTFPEDVGQMKAWMAERARWLDAEIGRRTAP